MRRLRTMIGKDLRRQVRSPLALVLVLAFPLVFAGLIALAFGGRGGGAPRVHLLVEDRDDTFLSGMLVSALTSEQLAETFAVEAVGAEGLERMERGEASALLRIPEGFAEDLLEGSPTVLELVRNPSQRILPEIAEQVAVVGVEVLSSGSHLLREPLDTLADALAGDGMTAAQSGALAVRIHDTLERSGELLFPPAITLETKQLGGADEGASGSGPTTAAIFLLVLPGISVWALFLTGDLAMRDIATEMTAGTLRRQLCAPLGAGHVVLAKALYTAVLAGLSWLVLTAIGALALERPVDLAGYALLSAAVIAAVTGFAAVVYGALRTQQQAGTVSSILLLTFAFLGGAFIRVEDLPAAVRSVSPLSPIYWATTGYDRLIAHGEGVTSILPNAGVLAALGIGLLVAGGWLLGRRVRRGAAA